MKNIFTIYFIIFCAVFAQSPEKLRILGLPNKSIYTIAACDAGELIYFDSITRTAVKISRAGSTVWSSAQVPFDTRCIKIDGSNVHIYSLTGPLYAVFQDNGNTITFLSNASLGASFSALYDVYKEKEYTFVVDNASPDIFIAAENSTGQAMTGSGDSPVGIIYDRHTLRFYTAKSGINCITVHDHWGKAYDTITEAGKDSPLKYPSDLAITPDGVLWAADTGNSRVVKYYPDLTMARIFDNKVLPGLFCPVEVDYNKRGEIIIIDSQQQCVYYYDDNVHITDLYSLFTILAPDGDGLWDETPIYFTAWEQLEAEAFVETIGGVFIKALLLSNELTRTTGFTVPCPDNTRCHVFWDGFGTNGVRLPNGKYNVVVAAKDIFGYTNSGKRQIDIRIPPKLTLMASTPAVSPNGDGVLDHLSYQFDLDTNALIYAWVVDANAKVCAWILSNNVYEGGPLTINWDCAVSNGVLPDGKYQLFTDSRGLDESYGVPKYYPFIIDTSVPVADIYTAGSSRISPDNNGRHDRFFCDFTVNEQTGAVLTMFSTNELVQNIHFNVPDMIGPLHFFWDGHTTGIMQIIQTPGSNSTNVLCSEVISDIAPVSGEYHLHLKLFDYASNHALCAFSNIIIDLTPPEITTATVLYISPSNADGYKDNAEIILQSDERITLISLNGTPMTNGSEYILKVTLPGNSFSNSTSTVMLGVDDDAGNSTNFSITVIRDDSKPSIGASPSAPVFTVFKDLPAAFPISVASDEPCSGDIYFLSGKTFLHETVFECAQITNVFWNGTGKQGYISRSRPVTMVLRAEDPAGNQRVIQLPDAFYLRSCYAGESGGYIPSSDFRAALTIAPRQTSEAYINCTPVTSPVITGKEHIGSGYFFRIVVTNFSDASYQMDNPAVVSFYTSNHVITPDKLLCIAYAGSDTLQFPVRRVQSGIYETEINPSIITNFPEGIIIGLIEDHIPPPAPVLHSLPHPLTTLPCTLSGTAFDAHQVTITTSNRFSVHTVTLPVIDNAFSFSGLPLIHGTNNIRVHALDEVSNVSPPSVCDIVYQPVQEQERITLNISPFSSQENMSAVISSGISVNAVLTVDSPVGIRSEQPLVLPGGKNTEVSWPSPVDGEYRISLTAADPEQNHYKVDRTVIRDTALPVLQLDTLLNDAVRQAECIISITEPYLETASLSVRGAGASSWTKIRDFYSACRNETILIDGVFHQLSGLHEIKIEARDFAGNSSSLIRTVFFDSAIKQLTVVSPSSGSYIKGVVPVSIFTAEPVSVALELLPASGGEALLSTAPAALQSGENIAGELHTEGVPDGAYIIRLTSVDTSGNSAVIETPVTVDNTIPVLSFRQTLVYSRTNLLLEVPFTENNSDLISAGVFNPDGSYSSLPFTVSGGASGYARIDIALNTQIRAEGEYLVHAEVRDKSGNSSYARSRVHIDRTAPRYISRSPAQTVIGGKIPVTSQLYDAIPFSISVEAQNTNTQAWNVIGDHPAYNASGSLCVWDTTGYDGPAFLRFTCIDRAGNTATNHFSYIIDNTFPVVTITNIQENGFFSNTVEALFNFSDTHLETCLIEYGEGIQPVTYYPLGTKQLSTNYTISDYSMLCNPPHAGRYTIRAGVRDLAGNITYAQRLINIDRNAPIVQMQNILPGAHLRRVVSFHGTLADSGFRTDSISNSMLVIRGGSVCFTNFSSSFGKVRGSLGSFNTESIPDGSYEMYAAVYDLAGFFTERIIPVTVDNTHPGAFLDIPQNAVVSSTAAFTGSVNDTHAYTWSVSIKSESTEQVSILAQGSGNVTGLLASCNTKNYPDGNYELTLTVADKAGNVTIVRRAITLANQMTITGVSLSRPYLFYAGSSETDNVKVNYNVNKPGRITMRVYKKPPSRTFRYRATVQGTRYPEQNVPLTIGCHGIYFAPETYSWTGTFSATYQYGETAGAGWETFTASLSPPNGAYVKQKPLSRSYYEAQVPFHYSVNPPYNGWSYQDSGVSVNVDSNPGCWKPNSYGGPSGFLDYTLYLYRTALGSSTLSISVNPIFHHWVSDPQTRSASGQITYFYTNYSPVGNTAAYFSFHGHNNLIGHDARATMSGQATAIGNIVQHSSTYFSQPLGGRGTFKNPENKSIPPDTFNILLSAYPGRDKSTNISSCEQFAFVNWDRDYGNVTLQVVVTNTIFAEFHPAGDTVTYNPRDSLYMSTDVREHWETQYHSNSPFVVSGWIYSPEVMLPFTRDFAPVSIHVNDFGYTLPSDVISEEWEWATAGIWNYNEYIELVREGTNGGSSVRIRDDVKICAAFVDVPVNAGSHQAVWDGRNDFGQRVPEGSYVIVLFDNETSQYVISDIEVRNAPEVVINSVNTAHLDFARGDTLIISYALACSSELTISLMKGNTPLSVLFSGNAGAGSAEYIFNGFVAGSRIDDGNYSIKIKSKNTSPLFGELTDEKQVFFTADADQHFNSGNDISTVVMEGPFLIESVAWHSNAVFCGVVSGSNTSIAAKYPDNSVIQIHSFQEGVNSLAAGPGGLYASIKENNISRIHRLELTGNVITGSGKMLTTDNKSWILPVPGIDGNTLVYAPEDTFDNHLMRSTINGEYPTKICKEGSYKRPVALLHDDTLFYIESGALYSLPGKRFETPALSYASISPDGLKVAAAHQTRYNGYDIISLYSISGHLLTNIHLSLPAPLGPLSWAGNNNELLYSSGGILYKLKLWYSPLQADITSPAENQMTAGLFSFTGSALDATFKRYIMELRTVTPQGEYGEWISLVQGFSPVHNGELFLLDTLRFFNGIYEMRLTVEDNADHRTSVIRRFIIANNRIEYTLSSIRKLTDLAGNNRHPVFHPDGNSIVFTSDRNGYNNLYNLSLTPTNANNTESIFTNTEYNGEPVITPDGQYIIYTALRQGNFDLYVRQITTGLERRLTDDPGYDGHPAITPDGKCVYFQSDRSMNMDIWKIPFEGGTAEKITFDSGYDGEPSVSSDGTRLAFVSDRSGKYDIWCSSMDGSGAYPIAFSAAPERTPSWMPASYGDLIAFSSGRTGPMSIYIGNCDIYDNAKMLGGSAGSEYSPSWSSDGARMVWSAYVNGRWDIFLAEVAVSTNTGLFAQVLTNHGGDIPVHIKPKAGEMLDNNRPVFEWSSIKAAATYEIQYSLSSDLTSEIHISGIRATTWQVPEGDELVDGKWFWRVRIKYADGTFGNFSPATSFTVYAKLGIDLLINYPNPCKDKTVIRYTLTRNADVNLQIFDITGRPVRMYTFKAGLPHARRGLNEVTWNILNGYGQKVANGVYICRLFVKSGKEKAEKVKKIAVIQ